jgi:phage terminase small subunit
MADKLTDKEESFINEYIKDFNATKAAERAKYSKSSARQIGSENLSKPYIREEIKKRLDSLELGKEAVKKMITDIATANVSNYFRPVKREHYEKIKVGLQYLIDELKAEMDFEDDYAMMASLKGKELERHEKGQEGRRRQMIRYKIELSKNPLATRIINGPVELIDDVEVDMAAIAADKEGGKIKSFKNGKYGLEVDLLPADNALVSMARIHSLFVDKSEVDNKVTISKPLIIDWGESK